MSRIIYTCINSNSSFIGQLKPRGKTILILKSFSRFLETAPSVGPTRTKNLLKHFTFYDDVTGATIFELNAIDNKLGEITITDGSAFRSF